jgi:hypothetical protein
MLRYLLVGFVFGALGCSGGSTGGNDGGNDGGQAQAPELTSIAPDHGPLSGTTLVTVNGANFDNGVVVKFGDRAGTGVIVSTKRKLTVRTPAGAALGKVAVTVVNVDGQTASLPNLYTYDPDTSKAIDEALVGNPQDATDSSGSAMVPVTILAQVSAGALTKGAGQGMGLKAQVGVATALSSPPAESDFTWTDATYTGDADGPTLGDQLRDAYKGDVMLAGVTAMQTKDYRLAARFSVDNGTTWVMADRDGIANGFTEPQIPKLHLTRPTVDWCKLGGEIFEAAPQVKLKTGAASPMIYAQVYKLAVTQMAGAGAGIKGQLGYGAASADPTTWTWIDATYNKDTGAGANDEWQAAFPSGLAVGSYAFAFRFNVDGGPHKYCDADGSDNAGFTIDQAGTLQVSGLGVDRCKLQFPDTLDARAGNPSGSVYGRVLAQTITEPAGAGPGIVGEVGYGPNNKLPDDPSWVWSAATYNVDAADGLEEWTGKITFAAVGTYSYGFRFKYQAGAYTYCDLDGSDNGITQAQLGVATVKVVDVDDCGLDMPSTLLAQPSGNTAPTNSHVWVTSVTEAAGQGAGITSEVGYGPVGTQPSTWTNWQAATFSGDAIFFDKYTKAIAAPAAAGTYDVAYRYKYQSRPYVYCDLDGAANGYQVAQAGKMTVATASISACKLQFVDKASVPSGDVVTGYVRVTVPGLSANAGATPGLRAQLGVGTAGDNASTSSAWGWREATFNVDAAGDDEFQLGFQPAYNGNRAVSARASLDNGASWTYCDLNGSNVNGYEVAQQFALMVSDHQDLDFCNLQFPPSITTQADAGAATIYGQLYSAGLTPNPAAPVLVQAGYGKKVEDPGLAWTWTNASFGSVVGNNNEYTSQLLRPVGSYQYAFRYSRDGGSWCFGDLNGNGKNGGSNDWAGFYGDATDGGLNLGLLTVQ